MELLLALVLGYLFVAPDRATLALTRGTVGAVRAGSGSAARNARPRRRRSASPTMVPPWRRAVLDGWREGVATARARRNEGRDLWSRGSRVAGRVAGGAGSVVRGAGSVVHRARRRDGPVTAATAGSESLSPNTAAPDTGDMDACRHCPEGVMKPVPGTRNADAEGSAMEDTKCNHCGVESYRSWTMSDDEYRTEFGYRYDDREHLVDADEDGPVTVPNPDDPLGPPSYEGEAELAWTRLKPGQYQTTDPAVTLTVRPQGDSFALRTAPPAEPTPTPPAAQKGPVHMSLGTTELANLDEVAGETKAAEDAMHELDAALAEFRKWAANLPDRWSGTNWSTRGLDTAINGLAEVASAIKVPEAVLEQLARIRVEIQKARSVGEAADATGATGDLSGFRAA